MMQTRTAILFYLGTFISNVGSFVFNVCLIAFLLKDGFGLELAALLIGFQRFIPVIISALFGHVADRLSPKSLVASTEIIAGICSIGLIICWRESGTDFWLLASLCVIRSMAMSLQTGSRGKIAKFLSDEGYSSNSRHAMWLNKVTQGATLVAGLIAWFIIRSGAFRIAAGFDFVTFIIGGISALAIPSFDALEIVHKSEWTKKFKELFTFNRHSFLVDLGLAVAVTGPMAFISRISLQDETWIAILASCFGVAVWASAFLERGPTSKIPTFVFFFLLSISLVAIGAIGQVGIPILFLILLRDLFYWVIYHRVSSHIQIDTPSTKIGSVTAARISIVILMSATGEILVGQWAPYISLFGETVLRGAVALTVGVLLSIKFLKTERLDDRPAL